jgi:hypothetical protein
MADKLTALFARLRLTVKNTLDAMPPPTRRLVLIAVAAALALLLLIFILTRFPAADKTGAQDIPVPIPLEARSGIIPPEDLFLPDEPDFLPGVMLEREQRESWTADDAAPWWIDPLKNGEQQWRDNIRRTVDIIMESVQ